METIVKFIKDCIFESAKKYQFTPEEKKMIIGRTMIEKEYADGGIYDDHKNLIAGMDMILKQEKSSGSNLKLDDNAIKFLTAHLGIELESWSTVYTKEELDIIKSILKKIS